MTMATAVCRGLSLGFSPSSSGNCIFLEEMSAKDDVVKWLVQRDNVYVHPPVGCAPSLRLSQKSLELCTENLGNETGSDASDTESSASGVFSSMTMAKEKEECLSKKFHGGTRKAEKYACFPPPLTTIQGSGDLQYKTHREKGRLVLEAVRASPTNAVFREERSQGRLTLSFVDEDEDNAEGRALKRTSGCMDSNHRSHHLQQENRGFTIWVATSY